MNSTVALVGRNLRIYFRNRAVVLLSLLSAVILVLLYLLFLGSLQVENLREALPDASHNDIAWFVGSWLYSGIVMITTLSTGLAALGAYVDDRVSGRFKEFRVAPLRRWQLILGYQLSAVVVATFVSIVVLLAGALLLKLLYGHSPAALDLATSVGLIVLLAMAFAALSSFLLTFVSSQGAYTAVSTIVGTLLGFLAGAYLPLGLLSPTMVNVLNVLPFSPAAMLLRGPLAGDALDALSANVPQARDAVASYYGFDLNVAGITVQPLWVVLVLLGVTAVFTTLGAWRIGRTIR